MNRTLLKKMDLLIKTLLVLIVILWIASSIYLTITYIDITQAMPWYMGILIPTLIAIVPIAIIIILLSNIRNKMKVL